MEIGGQKSGHGDNENDDGTDLRGHELSLHRVPSRSVALTLTTTSTRPGNGDNDRDDDGDGKSCESMDDLVSYI